VFPPDLLRQMTGGPSLETCQRQHANRNIWTALS